MPSDASGWVTAPAKVNLALHVTGRRADGYHDLDSLVVFAGVGDRVRWGPAGDLSLAVTGPLAAGVPVEGNLVLRAARVLAAARGVRPRGTITLEKHLPMQAGIGGGSSDAAAALRLCAAGWDVAPADAGEPWVAALGADVPVCLMAPAPVRMRGIGERLDPAGPLGPAGLVLVNPGDAVPTPAIFAALERRANPPLPDLPGPGATALAAWMRQQRNDLAAPAIRLAPAIGDALAALASAPEVLAAQMSGSGATCVGLCADLADAEAVAADLARPGWWVRAAALL